MVSTVPTNAVRKLRWTYAADLQAGAFTRSEFQVVVSNWTVTGANRGYVIAGPGSRRIEDDSSEIIYSGQWTESKGNYSGGSIRYATVPGASIACTYSAQRDHQLYLGNAQGGILRRRFPSWSTVYGAHGGPVHWQAKTC